MLNYAIFLMGENFPMDYDGDVVLQGFFVTKRVEAENEEVAREMAIAGIKSTPIIASSILLAGVTEPTIQVKVVHLLPDHNKMKDTEFVFFPMEDD